MRMTDETIRQGVSEIGNYRLNYTITYNADNRVRKIELEIKRIQAERTEQHIGYAFHTAEPSRYTFQLTGEVSAEERRILIDDFEKTIKELME